jgi:hypothetical protein
LTHFSSFLTDVSIYKDILALDNTGSAATYTTYPVDTHLVVTTSFAGSTDLRDQGSDKLYNVPAMDVPAAGTSCLARYVIYLQFRKIYYIGNASFLIPSW